jgi:hypothetical protein
MEMFNKLNLQTYDRVRLVKLGPEAPDSRTPLNGREGSVAGVATRHIIDCYIVLLDESYITNDFVHLAVSIPECCLERIGLTIS